MWISDVDVPEELLEAARAGTLVVFVGAGASREAPASLPDFRQLTSGIAAEAALLVKPEELDVPDRLLGRIADAGVDVHQRVRALIDTPGSAPNALHAAIVDLALATRAPRIVTTNYDSHLTSVVRARGLPWTEYMAPALPMGDDFVGVVYLHGSLSQESRHLIVTDADFGRAYLRDAWAARFLERMFAKFTVLFVGYSHADVVMRYLARSLGPRSNRFVMTHRPDEPDWRALNLRPVGYQVRSSSHVALTELIERWARLLSMGLLDHRQRIAQLVAAPPSAVPEEASYLSSVIGDDQTVRLFTDLADGEAWLAWVAAQPESRQLFDPSADASACSFALADWFTRQWLADEASSKIGLGIVSAAGGHMSGTLWNAIGHELHGRGAPRAAWLNPWIAMLLENAPAEGQHWLEYALVASRLPDDRDVALLLFDHLTEPHIVLKPSFGPGAAARFDVELRGDDYWLRDSWTKVLQPGLASIVHDVLAIADRHLRRAGQLLIAAGAATRGWDPVSFGRSSIATHPQDRHGDRIGLVIDAARDCLDFLVANDAPMAGAVIGAWSASETPVLRRLAIHGVTIDNMLDGSEKLAWLLDHGFPSDHWLKHEVFELLAAALPFADDSVVDRVVDEVALGPTDVDGDDVHAYEAFNALVWIDRHSTAPSAKAALARAKAEHPNFGVREHPDFDTWSEAGFRSFTAPMPAEDFHALLHLDRSAALAKLAESKGTRVSIDKPTWDDAIELVRQVVQEHPEDRFVLLGGNIDLDDDLIRATVEGWASRKLPDDVALLAIERLAALDLDRWSDELARLLGGLGSTEARTEWHRFKGARDLARAIAHRLAAEPVRTDASNWLERAVNEPGGLLAEFWLHAVSYEWNSDRDRWTGLGGESRGAIDDLLRRGDLHGAFAEVIVASQLHFFFAADREWCQANVMPLLDWDNPERARRTWDGFLFWGRWTDQLLEAGLLRSYLDTARHVEAFGDEMCRRLAEHLAAVSLYSEIDPGTWAAAFTRDAPAPLRVEWLNQVAWTLGRLDAEVRQRQWSRWMRDYWARRLDSIPLRLTCEEASALAGWVVYLEDSIDEAVGLAVASPAGLEQHGQVLLELSNHAERSPAACARLLGHLLTGTKPPFWHCDLVQEVVAKVRGHAPEEALRQIREESLRLGCTTAAAW